MNTNATRMFLLAALMGFAFGCTAQTEPSDKNDTEAAEAEEQPNPAPATKAPDARIEARPDRRVNIMRKLGKAGARRAPQAADHPQMPAAPEAH
ncbi:MAG: hypothetical protein QM820_35685 [Minicystis sp.]